MVEVFAGKKTGQKGFTLIELLVVISILGVLAAVAVPNVAKFMNSGKVVAANTELANVRLAITVYQADNNGASPADTAALVTAKDLLQPTTGTYTIAAGEVTTATYSGATWDATAKKFN